MSVTGIGQKNTAAMPKTGKYLPIKKSTTRIEEKTAPNVVLFSELKTARRPGKFI